MAMRILLKRFAALRAGLRQRENDLPNSFTARLRSPRLLRSHGVKRSSHGPATCPGVHAFCRAPKKTIPITTILPPLPESSPAYRDDRIVARYVSEARLRAEE